MLLHETCASRYVLFAERILLRGAAVLSCVLVTVCCRARVISERESGTVARDVTVGSDRRPVRHCIFREFPAC